MRKNSLKSKSKLINKEALTQSLKFPGDVVMGAFVVTMTGNREAWIENYRGILEYTDTVILLQGKTCQICFQGKELSIDYYTNEDMKISGCIHSVTYL